MSAVLIIVGQLQRAYVSMILQEGRQQAQGRVSRKETLFNPGAGPILSAHQMSMMAPPMQKSMAMGAPMKKGMDTAEGRGTNFLYAPGTMKSLIRLTAMAAPTSPAARSAHQQREQQRGLKPP